MENYLLHINNIPVVATNNDYTILQQCEQLGISIPRFCYHSELSIAGNCRMCMVEVKNSVKPVIACATSLSKGLVVFTNSDLVRIARENVLEFLLINHPLDCPICDQGGECDLQDQTMVYGSDRGRFKELKRSVEDKEFGPVIKTIMTRCIHCTRCIRFSEEIAGVNILGMMGRGKDSEISTYTLQYYNSEITGNIVDVCPVGALTSKPYAFRARPWELVSIEGIDLFDSLCSKIRIDLKGNEILRILPIRNQQLNSDWITDKVRFCYQGFKLDRGSFPMRRVFENNNYKMVSTSWEIALSLYKEQLLNNNIIVNCGNLLSFTDLYKINKIFGNNNNISLNYSNLPSFNSDIRSNWLINQQITSLLSSDNLIFLNTNLKYQNSVLNARIVKEKYNRENNLSIFYIGGNTDINYKYKHQSIVPEFLFDVYEGRSKCCTLGKNTTLISSEDTSYIINDNFNFSYLADKPSTIGALELGYFNNSNFYTNKIYMTAINIGIENINIKADYFILQHFFISSFPNLFLPTVAPFEHQNYITVNSLLQFKVFNKIVDSIGIALTNSSIFDSLGIWDENDFNNNSNDYYLYFFNLIQESDFFYKPTLYIQDNNINLSFNTLYKSVTSKQYYKSDEVSIRSKTLQSSYLLSL